MSLPDVMRAAVLVEPGKIEMRDVPVPRPLDGWSLIRCEYTGLCGTDFAILHGMHPRAKFPLIMGHEIVGQVARSTSGGPAVGTRVTVEPLIVCGECDACRRGDTHVCKRLGLFGIDQPGALAEYIALPNDTLIAIPEGVSPVLATLTEPLSVAVHAVAFSPLKPGDRVAVFGAGPIGILTALVARHAGAREIIVIEPSEGRTAVAKRLGFSVIPPGSDIIDFLNALTGGEGADLVFDAAAHPSVAAILPASVRSKGTIVLVGVYKKPTAIDLQAVTFKEIKMIGVRVYARADVETAVKLISTDALGLAQFPIEVFSLEQTRQGFDRALSAGNILKVIIDAGKAS